MKINTYKNNVVFCACVVMLGVLGVITGCGGGGKLVNGRGGIVPPDFSVAILVVNSAGENGGEKSNSLRESGSYLLEPDRSVRGIRGEGGFNRTYPPLLRVADPVEVENVYWVVFDKNLMSEPTSPLAKQIEGGESENMPQVVYCVELTANGRTCKYRTTAVESPGTVRLLIEILEVGYSRRSVVRKGL